MKQLYYLLLGIGCCVSLKGQIIFEKTLGNIGCYDEAFGTVLLNEEFVVSGNFNCTAVPGNFSSKFWKLNTLGNIIDSAENNKFSGFIGADNTDMIFAGGNKAGLIYDTIIVSQATATFNTNWQKKYNLGVCNNVVYDVQTVTDGYLIAGFYSTQNCAIAEYDAFVLKLDKQGNEQWLTPIGGDANQQFYAVKQHGNNISAFGWTNNTPNGIEKFFLTRFNLNGDSITSLIIDTTGAYKGYGMDVVSDGYIINGTKDNSEVVAMKIDFQGNIIWQKNLGMACGSSYYKAYKTIDEQYLFTYISSGSLSCSTTLVKTDILGNEYWQKTFPATIRSVNEIKAGSFLVSGFKLRSDNFISDAYVALFDTTFLTVNITDSKHDLFQVFPNPATKMLQLNISGETLPLQYQIIDMQGKIIDSKPLLPNQVTIPVAPLTSGIYTLQLLFSDQQLFSRFIKM